jgi:hypothetical protein
MGAVESLAWDGSASAGYCVEQSPPPRTTGRRAFATAEIMKHNLFLKKKKSWCRHRRIFLFQEQMGGLQELDAMEL